MHNYLTIAITAALAEQSIETILKEQYGFSKKAISRLKISEQSFLLNGKRANSTTVAHLGDSLVVPLFDQAPPRTQIVPQKLALTIVYEDAQLLVVDKAAPLPMYPHRAGGLDSLANALAYYYPGQIFHAYNRLDTTTAGLVAIAKSAFVLHQLQRYEADKYYLAWVCGAMEGSGIIDLPLLHQSGQPRVLVDARGKEARSAYRVLHTERQRSLVEVQLLTGRTHQIRAHLAALGHPLLGDCLYGAPPESTFYPSLLAYRLDIVQPMSHERLSLESPRALCF